MNENFLKSRSTYIELQTALYEKIKKQYEDADKIFTPASPYGQILDILASFQENWLFFLDDIANESNIKLANRLESVYGLASLSGHNPTRSIAANGLVTIKFKTPDESIRGKFAILSDKVKLRCENNNLPYFLEIPNVLGDTRLDMLTNDSYTYNIIQGVVEKSTLFGTGESLTSFEIPSKQVVDNDRIYVSVNGENWSKIDSLYDMNANSKHFMVRTNMDGGVTILFGNGYFGKIPTNGSLIEISYVVSDGFNGNLNNVSNSTTFKFIDNTVTELGEDLDLNSIATVSMKTPIILGSDSEDVELTKLIAPYMSKSFVLANSNNYKHFLSRFDFLSTIEVWNTDVNENVFYMFLTPKILKYIENPLDYYSLPTSKIVLSSDYENAILEYIIKSQRQLVSTELKFVKGIVTKYVANVYLRIFDDVPESLIISTIHDSIANYFLENTRRDRIPKSDLIKVVENISGVDSVNFSFTSERNEKAIIDGFYIKNGVRIDLAPLENPQIGLDEFGDILIQQTEIPIIRGDFYDRFNNYYNSGIVKNGYGCLNVFIKEKIKRIL